MSAGLRAAGWLLGDGAPLSRARWHGRPAALQRMDRLCGLALIAADEALSQAALPAARDEAAVVFGTAHGCHETDEAYYRGLLAGPGLSGASPRLFAYTLPSSPAGEIAIHYGLQGPALCVTAAQTAGLEAMATALGLLRHGRARLCVVAAADVGSPLLADLTGQKVRDAGVALVLSADAGGLGRIVAVAERFCPGDPAAALAEALTQLPPAPAYADPATAALLSGPAIASPADLCPEGLGAAGALLTLARLAQGPADQALVLSADPLGHAACALWHR